MHKTTFRTLARNKDGEIAAIKKDGFTDNDFNYYRGKDGWFAIDPLSGLSVYKGKTKKETIDFVHSADFVVKFNDKKKTADYIQKVAFFYKKQVECGAIVKNTLFG